MRFGNYLVAMMVFAAGAQASEWRVTTSLPAGGLPVNAPGFRFHTPGVGWEMLSGLPPKDGAVAGHIGMVFSYSGPGENQPPDPQKTVASFGIRPLFGGGAGTVEAFDAEIKSKFEGVKAYHLKQDPKASIGFITEDGDGMHCAGWRIASTEPQWLGDVQEPAEALDFTRACIRPEFPAFVVMAEFDAAWAPATEQPTVVEEGQATLRSLTLDAPPFRTRAIVVPGLASDLVEMSGAIWASYIVRSESVEKQTTGGVVRIDPETNAVVANIPIRAELSALVADPFGVWVSAGNRLLHIAAQSNTIDRTIALPLTTVSLIAGGGYLWATCDGNNPGFGAVEILRIEPKTGHIDTIAQPGGRPLGLLFADGALHVAVDAGLMRFDPENLRLTGSIPVETGSMEYDGRYVWNLVRILQPLDRDGTYPVVPAEVKLERYDLRTPQRASEVVLQTKLPARFGAYRYARWNGKVCLRLSEGLMCVTPRAPGEPPVMMGIPGYLPGDMMVSGGSLWVSSGSEGLVIRLDPK